MGFFRLLITAVGVSMDAFAVAISKGLSVDQVSFKQILKTGLWFGGFQALMPLLGFLFAKSFSAQIQEFDHWVAFILLGIIGLNMIREARSGESETLEASFSIRHMFPLAVATSIDAAAVGVTFAFLNVKILPAVFFIGVCTFVFSCAGVQIGNIFGVKYKKKAEYAGGIILILIGLTILIEHLFMP